MIFLRVFWKFTWISLIIFSIPAGIVAIPYFLFISYVYWHPTSLYGLDIAEEAVFDAFNFDELDPNRDETGHYLPCDWDSPDLNRQRCVWLDEQTRRYCHWWTGDLCRPYMLTDQLLDNPERFKTTIHAVVNPCLYREETSAQSPDFNTCSTGHTRFPVVLILKGKDREIRMRFDFAIPRHEPEQKG